MGAIDEFGHCIAMRRLKSDLFWGPEWQPFASLSVGAGVGIWCRELCPLQPHSFQFNIFLVRSKPSGESKG